MGESGDDVGTAGLDFFEGGVGAAVLFKEGGDVFGDSLFAGVFGRGGGVGFGIDAGDADEFLKESDDVFWGLRGHGGWLVFGTGWAVRERRNTIPPYGSLGAFIGQ